LENILKPSREEKRTLTADEAEKFDKLENEIREIDTTIGVEVRQLAIASQKAQPLSKTEERDVAGFDIGRVLNHLHRSARGSHTGQLDGIEAEMLQEGEKEARASGLRSGGVFLPRML